MICSRCGEAESATDTVIVAGFDRPPELVTAIDLALRRSGIQGVHGLGSLCERCWAIARAAIDEALRQYLSTRPAFIEEQWERNLGRPPTSSERDVINRYCDGPANPGAFQDQERLIKEDFDEDRARAGLEAFAAGSISAAELEERLGGRLRLRHPLYPWARQINGPLPCVPLTRAHLSSILARALQGQLDAAAVARWAGLVLLLNGSHRVSEPNHAPCYGLDAHGPLQSTLTRIVWEVVTASTLNELSATKLQRWLDELTGDDSR